VSQKVAYFAILNIFYDYTGWPKKLAVDYYSYYVPKITRVAW